MAGSPSHDAKARFTSGSILRHVVTMSVTGAVGLVSLFLVDLADMFFLSLLGEVELAAAVGFAGTILFFTTSISIGLSIAMGALVSRAIGGGGPTRARRFAINNYVFGLICAVVVVLVLWPSIPFLLSALGATGRTHELATGYLQIVVPSMPLLSLGMSSGAILRATGDARRAMYVALSGGLANAVFDPILIFGLDLGIDGAASASVIARTTIALTGLYGVVRVHRMIGGFKASAFLADLKAIVGVAGPATLTSVATPIGYAYVTAAIAKYGDGAVAGYAIVGRVTPVAFALFFSLSGAVGPIIGQNLGAGKLERVNRTLVESLKFIAVYTLLLWALLYALQEPIIWAFDASPEAATLIRAFCLWVVPLTFFLGALFVANAAFNNLGRAIYATAANFGRATLGTIPFVYVGGQLYGAVGVIVGQAIGAMVFGILAVAVCFWVIARMTPTTAKADTSFRWRTPLSAFSSGRVYNVAPEELAEQSEKSSERDSGR